MRDQTLTGLLLSLAAVCALGPSTAGRAAEMQGHHFGRWPAISAVIAEETQKNLNLDDQDFLIEIWFKPLAVLNYKWGPSFLVSKKSGDALAGYSLSYSGQYITLALCDRQKELDDDMGFSVDAGLKEGQWCYFAAAYCHRAGKLTLFVDGKPAREFDHVLLGDVSNRDPLNIGYYENRNTSPAHCEMAQARIWKLPGGLPADIAAIVAAHRQTPGAVSEGLVKGAHFSRWMFSAANDDIDDLGNNGNRLCYAPWHYQGATPIKPFPPRPAGRTYYVSSTDAAASDAGPGSREKPFRTIKRGAKATAPGDVLHVGRGLYRETVSLRAGENGRPVTMEGEPGAVICGSDSVGPWKPAGTGLWQVAGWAGRYCVPDDVNERDVRAHPSHLLFVDDYPLDYVKTKAELVPGTWHLEPLLGWGPKTITICPLPGVDPAKAPVEITNRLGMTTSKFNHVRGLCFLRAPCVVGGVGCVFENNTVAWSPFCNLGIYGQYHVVRGNRILWGGNSGVGGCSIGLRFEHNYLAYNGWRNFDPNWHGGAVKLIPANVDHVMRDNEVCYNCISGIWYDTENQGNRIEWNHCHDNATIGLFDEYSFGNTFQHNLVYNNEGSGLGICNSSEDTAYRNIFYNNDGTGVFFRWDAPHPRCSPAEYEQQKADTGGRIEVRRFQGLIPYQREKLFRDFVEKYTWCYPEGSIVAKSRVLENAIFDNWGWGGVEINQPVHYSTQGKVDPELVNTFDGNIYWNPFSTRIFTNGSYCQPELDLAQWQRLSGQDQHSRWLNPLEHSGEMPEWFKKRFPFKQGDVRPIHQVLTEIIPSVKRGVARTILMSRVLRAKRIEPIPFTDPALFGLRFDAEGGRCAALWSRGAGVREFLVGGAARVTAENKFAARKDIDVRNGRLSLYVQEEPVTLIGFDGQIREDRSVLIDLPWWTDPGRPVTGKILLENVDRAAKRLDLRLSAGARWTVAPGNITRVLDAGGKASVAVVLRPVGEVRQGAFSLRVAGAAGRAKLDQSKTFGVGCCMALKHVEQTPKFDGQFLPWAALPPSGVAETRGQVVAGAENWRGPDDLSAKVWLGWHEDADLYFAIDVTDDRLVTSHRDDDPARSDSVELFVDVRPPWKQYMKSYTPATFKLVFVPGDGKVEATSRYRGTPYGFVRRLRSEKRAKGYRLEADIHFFATEVDDPGWAAGRPVRIGVLVHDCDDPSGKPKSTLALWNTAADAAKDCTSLAAFLTEKRPGP